MSDVRKEAEQRLYEVLDQVHDEKTFCEFLNALSHDWYQEQEIERATPSGPYSPGALGWENGTIGAFLDAASVGLYGRSEETNPWKRAAHIIWLGKIYK
jgi:hypothetical protein